MKATQTNNRLQNIFPVAMAEVDSLVDQFFGPVSSRGAAWRAPASIWEGKEHLHMEVDAPGVTLDDVDITFDKGRLSLTLERKSPEYEGTLWHSERGYGKVTRTVSLPETVDPETIEATLSNGVLRVSIGKRPELQPKRIEVKTA
ncbi:Hsp20/alpha crystallin family protein [Aeoliella sp. ICT_H6.2]|uniref:Hsp20/alpha crystallin family protein n=1 Tax=Aeoliella straminimaris TaxID=2954799 RepID=A0A9X2F6M8_9BACT|nr:Hsp20/alpha crystallin family protein [Aeoliella straminimaris]MCO6042578.1 Hsp20/alpha crystallin family protein [Aeoliella straminimaris]